MIKKRFELMPDDEVIIDNCDDGGRQIYWVIEYGQRAKLVKLLNKLNDENEQLKQKMLRLYNYFENWFEDMMSPTAFSEMWDTVKEDKKWER